MPYLHRSHNRQSRLRVSFSPTAELRHSGTRTETPDVADGPIVLVLAADNQFAMPLGVTLYSALTNLRENAHIVVYVLDGGLDSVSRLTLERVVAQTQVNARLEIVAPEPERLDKYSLRREGRFSPAVFLRLLIPELLPQSCEKAIYLDSDTIVEADLTHLWRKDVVDHALLAVRERDVASPFGLHNWRDLGLAPNAPYFNSGVLVLNLRRWRNEHIADDVLEYLADHRNELNLPHDQEGLNAILAGRWGLLDASWNLIYPFYDPRLFEDPQLAAQVRSLQKDLIRDPHIIHFNVAEKPWNPRCTHPARARFYAYLKRSEWFGAAEYYRWRVRMLPIQTGATLKHAAKKKVRRLRNKWPASSPRERASNMNGQSSTSTANESIVLVLAADEAFAMPLAVTLYSALVNLRRDCRPQVYVLDGGIHSDSRRKIVKAALRAHSATQVEFVVPEAERLSAYTLKMEKRFSKSIFLRLLTSELLPRHLHKAIYLDSDMVVETDLMRLWQTEMGNNVVLAVQDFAIPFVSSTPRGLFNRKELGLSPDAPYFNSGLLVMNLQTWRAESIGEQILDYLSRNRDHLNMHGNQEGFNAVLAGRWGKLDARWNLIHHIYDPLLFKSSNADQVKGTTRTQLTQTAFVIHYTARRKPWDPTCVHAARNRFFYYQKRSGWFTQSEYVHQRLHLVPRQMAASLRHQVRSRIRPLKQALRGAVGSRANHVRSS